MTLRLRLLLAWTMLILVVAGGAVTLVRSQRSYLVSQIDEQLGAIAPLIDVTDGSVQPNLDPAPGPAEEISTLFTGHLVRGRLVPRLTGLLLDDVPDLAGRDVEEAIGSGPFTVDGESGRVRFRALLVSRDEGTLLVALPLSEVDRTIGRLTWTLAAGTAAIVAVLAVAMLWVERLGLRPIARVTAAARAIASGERHSRVGDVNLRTEAGELARAFNVMLDQRDDAEDKLRRFVADASHELRTPLTSIRGYLDLYQEGGFGDAEQAPTMIRRLDQETRRMQALVEDLLLLADLDQRRPLQHEPVDIAQLVRDAATDAHAVQPTRPIAVVTDDRVDVLGDPFRLQQVVAAVVSNALTHTPAAAQLHLGAHRRGHHVEILIADDGPGLAAEHAARVFDRFYRASASRERRHGGSGLGLAIARSIVEAHGGSIGVDTAPGDGCRFTILLAASDPSLTG